MIESVRISDGSVSFGGGMIQVDDSGSGSFVGGTCIGIYRPETNEYYFDIIPVELYSVENFAKKKYLDEVVNIVEAAFRVLCPAEGEIIEVCRGYMFDRLKIWLTENGYRWYSTQITGQVQEIVEKSFELYAERLGLPGHYIKYTRYPFHFHKLLRWVYADFENRIRLCKVGWKCWQKIAGLTPDISDACICAPSFICMKCGRYIKPGSEIRVIRFVSNRENYVYLHKACHARRSFVRLPDATKGRSPGPSPYPDN
jgi:hypothetical protein